MALPIRNKKLLRVLVVFTMTLCVVACKKNKPKPADDGPKQPYTAITSLSTYSGPYNTTVVITGRGFDDVTNNNKVFFNGKPATISASSNTSITVTVPLAAGTGKVTLSVDGTTVTGPVFTYEFHMMVTTYFGYNAYGIYNFGPTAKLWSLEARDIIADAEGNLLVTEPGYNVIERIDTLGNITAFAGVHGSTALSWDGIGNKAFLAGPNRIAADINGNFYFTENSTNRGVRKLTTNAEVTTLMATYEGKLWPLSFFVGNPSGIAIDKENNLYVSDGFYAIKKISPAGEVTNFAGVDAGFADGPANVAKFKYPDELVLDSKGNLYVADRDNFRIRKITKDGMVSTFAGNDQRIAKDGTGVAAGFMSPQGLYIDAADNIYVADAGSHQIRKITPAGVVSTIAGTGKEGIKDGLAEQATFIAPVGITMDKAGNLYVTDQGSLLVRKIGMQ